MTNDHKALVAAARTSSKRVKNERSIIIMICFRCEEIGHFTRRYTLASKRISSFGRSI